MLRYFWTATQKDGIRDTCTEYNVPSKVRDQYNEIRNTTKRY